MCIDLFNAPQQFKLDENPTPRRQITTICQNGTAIEKPAFWKFVNINKSIPTYNNNVCQTKSYDILFETPVKEQRDNVYIMNNCKCNEHVGLSNRYLKQCKNEMSVDHKIVNKILDELCTELQPHFNGPISITEFFNKKKGKLLTRYTDAANGILNNSDFNIYKNNKITAFIKNEIYDEIKPPRMILGRNPKFNMAYGRYTSALEHAMQQLPQVSKGKNFKQRGEQFFQLAYRKFMFECDFSKFEATQRLELLKLIELGIWKRLLTPEQYIKIERMFYAKMQKKGTTLNGLDFEFWYCRGSGDMDTGLFNTLLTYVSCKYFLKVNKLNGDFICDGDDNVMGVNEVTEYIDTFAHFGFDAKIIIRHDYHDVDYCSGKFIQYRPGKFIYVQNLNKLMKNLGIFRKEKFKHCKGVYYHSLGFMYQQIYGNLPIYRDISKFLLRLGKGKHVSTEILEELNPAHFEAFKSTDYTLDIDENTCRVEIAMCFLDGTSAIDTISAYYHNLDIKLEPIENKRFNNTKPPRIRLTQQQLDSLELELDAGITEIPIKYLNMSIPVMGIK